jgi:hypothetical protein
LVEKVEQVPNENRYRLRSLSLAQWLLSPTTAASE